MALVIFVESVFGFGMVIQQDYCCQWIWDGGEFVLGRANNENTIILLYSIQQNLIFVVLFFSLPYV